MDVRYCFENEEKNVVVKTLKKGDFFGKESFFSTSIEHYTTVSKGIVTLAYIEFNSFVENLKKHESEYQKFCSRRDVFLFNNN